MVRNNRQAAYERLIILAEKQGYVTFDNVQIVLRNIHSPFRMLIGLATQ